MSKLGTSDFSAIYLGGSEVVKAYLGTDVVYQKGSSLPYDAQVEYIETDGTQSIDGIYTEKSSTSVLVFQMGVNGVNDIIGNTTSYQRGSKIVGDSTTGIFAYYKPAGTRILLQISNGYNQYMDITATFNKSTKKFTITDGTTTKTGTYAGYISTVPHGLFMRKHSNVSARFNGKFYYLQILEDGVLAVDLIPVRVGTTGYIYDRVSGTLYSEAFTAGPDV